MKNRWILLALAMLLLLGCAAGAAGEMAFETEILSFEIDSNEGAPRYDAIVEVRNTGTTAIHLGYTAFSVTDAENRLVATEDSSAIYALPSVVYPGESGFYFTARIELPASIDPSQTYHLVYDTDAIRPTAAQGIADYEVINVSFPDNDYMNIIGEIVNGSDTGEVDVLCVCRDEQGRIVTLGGTLEELKTSHNTYFQIINYGAWGKDSSIARYDMIARKRGYE